MSTVFGLKKNNAKNTLDGPITNVATSLTVVDGSVYPATGNFWLVIWKRATHSDPGSDGSNAERVQCTGRTGNTLTIVRAQEGTSGVSHADGETVMLTFSKASATEYETAINERLPEAGGSTYDTDDAKVAYTAIGGIAIRLTNKTGGNSVAGELVEASDSFDDAVELVPAGDYDPIGAFLDDGVADGSEAWVVVGGICDVMLEDGTDATQGNWVRLIAAGGAPGRADAEAGTPPGAIAAHFAEIGHCIETVGDGTDVKARIVMHFL